MGRLVLWMQQSLDGFTEGRDGDFEWPVVADDTHTYFNERIEATVGAFVYGRKTFEMMASFWPGALDIDHTNTARFAKLWVPTPKLVASRTLTHADWNSTIVRGDLGAELTRWKGEIEGDLILIGSGTVAAELVRAGTVDEHHVFTHPVILGGGRRLYPELDERIPLELVEARTFGGGVVLHRHVRKTR